AGSYPEPAPTRYTLYTVPVSATSGAGLTGPAASGQATTALVTTTLHLCYLAPSTNPAALPEDYMLSTASNCTEPPFNGSGMEACVPDANVAAWATRGFTSNRGGFCAAG
ncbi:MAG: hypothetical protein J2O39_09030, partial [Acidimicrobiales bacterium]|nr:hypothetical protein [Acidimicrobiales bacterium]